MPSNFIQTPIKKKNKEVIYNVDKTKNSFPIGMTYPVFPKNHHCLKYYPQIREANKNLDKRRFKGVHYFTSFLFSM